MAFPVRPATALSLATLLMSASASAWSLSLYQPAPAGDLNGLIQFHHEIGRKHPNVAAILSRLDDGDLFPAATGTLVEYSEDGQWGYLLTAAHPFFTSPTSSEPGHTGQGPIICFDPSVPADGKGATLVQATRLLVHPQRTPATLESLAVRRPFILPKVHGGGRKDLALLEFAAKELRPALAKAGVAKARILDESRFPKAVTEARVVGRGLHGTTWTRGFLVGTYAVSGGYTTVCHATYGDLTGFFHWAPIHEMAFFEMATADPEVPRPYRFDLGGGDEGLVNPLDGSPASIRSAPEGQVMTNLADSGAPGFLKDSSEGPEELKLAMVAIGAQRADLRSPFSKDRPDVPCYLERFEPVDQGTVQWIRDVAAGGDGKSSLVMVFGAGPDSAAKAGPAGPGVATAPAAATIPPDSKAKTDTAAPLAATVPADSAAKADPAAPAAATVRAAPTGQAPSQS